MSAKDKINLLPKDPFDSSTIGKFFRWAINVGRWIVVFTEFIVICAFLSRFYFDTELSNLFDEVKQKQVMVDAALPFEDNFRSIQDKTKLIKNILAQEKVPSSLVTDISRTVPLDVTLDNLSIDENVLTITGTSLSESGINIFVRGLTSLQQIAQVTLTNISSKKDVPIGIGFNISATIKE